MQRSKGKIFLIGVVASLLISGILLSQARRQSSARIDRPAGAVPLSGAAGSGATPAQSAADLRARAATTTRLALDDAPTITVYKTPTCGCCTSWVAHLEEHGFEVETDDLPNLNRIKARHGITGNLASCHTAEVDGYVIEGHVPADLIERILVERPEIRGLAVPGMPMGSPGMEGPYTERYNVLAFDAAGRIEVYERR